MSEEHGIWDGGIPWISFSFQKIIVHFDGDTHCERATTWKSQSAYYSFLKKKAHLLLPVDSTTNTWEFKMIFGYIRASTKSVESIDSHWRSLDIWEISCISAASLLCVSCLWKISSGFSILPGARIWTKYLLTPLHSSNRLSYGRRWVCMMRSF